jgi:hypothetical protein
MAVPCDATGYGNGSVARKVFGIDFDENLSSAIVYKCWDSNSTFPATDNEITVANTIFAGTTANGSKPMISLLDTTNAAPASEDWKPWTATAGEANPNRMKGDTNYVEQDGSDFNAGYKTFNMDIEVPNDAQTSSTMQFDLVATFTYTGSDPTAAYVINEGTEGSPTWTELTSGTHGIRHCRSDSNTYANIPLSTYVQPDVFDGAGLNDLTAGGSFSAATIAKFEVEITGNGTPDVFKWRKNVGSYTTGVNITGAAQTLSDGVTVTFAATTGHTIGDEWTIYAGCQDTAKGRAVTA